MLFSSPKFHTDTPLKTAILACGFLMAGAQVLIIRRALALTGGDEVVFALALTVWLLAVAAGSSLGVLLTKRISDSTKTIAILLGFLSLAVSLAPISIITIARLFSWLPGTVPGSGGLIIPLAASMLPVGLTGGILFPLCCHAVAKITENSAARVYFLEAVGSFIAGLLTALIFAPHFSSLTLAFCFALSGLGAALFLLKPKIPIWLVLLVSIIAAPLFNPLLHQLDQHLFSELRPGIKLDELLETPYGLIEITERHGQNSVYENGLLLAVSDDPTTAEERAHLTLSQHPDPRIVLWIGGFLGGSLLKALEHPSIIKLDIVELNPILFDLEDRFISAEGRLYSVDRSVSLHREDGRKFISKSPSQSYDVIALNLPGPKTARLAKFYTVEFFEAVSRVLKPGGILVFFIESSEDYIGEDLAELIASLYKTCAEVFPTVEIMPGANALFIAGDATIAPVMTSEDIMVRLEARNIDPLYWDKYRLKDRLTPDRKRMLSEAVHDRSVAKLNRDSAPICFYMQQIYWSQQVRGGLANILKAAKNVLSPWWFLLLIIFALLSLVIKILFPGKKRQIGAGWAVFTVGLSGLSLEILALISYQMYFGSGYREIGLLTGFYMAGLASGAAYSTRVARRRDSIFRIIQLSWGVVPLVFVMFVSFGSDMFIIIPGLGLGFFVVYIFGIGLLGGLHFPLALSYSGRESSQRAGIYYSLDLGGAAIGAMVVGFFLLPLVGIAITCLIITALNLIPLMLLFDKGNFNQANR